MGGRVKTLQGEREREKESRGGGRKGITWNGTLISNGCALTSNLRGEGKLIWGRGGEGGLMEKDVEDTKKKQKKRANCILRMSVLIPDQSTKEKRNKKKIWPWGPKLLNLQDIVRVYSIDFTWTHFQILYKAGISLHRDCTFFAL